MTDITKVLYCFGCDVSKGLQLFSSKQRESTRPVCMACISRGNKARRNKSRQGPEVWRRSMKTYFLKQEAL